MENEKSSTSLAESEKILEESLKQIATQKELFRKKVTEIK
jgi:hypothetical protein